MEELCEDDLVPVEPKEDELRGRTLERKQSSVDIIKQLEQEERDEEMERQLVCLASMKGSRTEPEFPEGEESLPDGVEIEVGVRRRRRREKSKFILTEEDEEQQFSTATSSN
ncbi:hypothetical protein FRC18_007966 [Serendipita sp. 400]|nr:hypothetical protein FRC18_007966 [Serendipita sp. 400]